MILTVFHSSKCYSSRHPLLGAIRGSRDAIRSTTRRFASAEVTNPFLSPALGAGVGDTRGAMKIFILEKDAPPRTSPRRSAGRERRRRFAVYFHQGSRPVRKSVSVQGEKMMVSVSLISACARARERGAGPRITLPSLLYWEPWQGHLNLFSALFQGTTQPR